MKKSKGDALHSTHNLLQSKANTGQFLIFKKVKKSQFFLQNFRTDIANEKVKIAGSRSGDIELILLKGHLRIRNVV